MKIMLIFLVQQQLPFSSLISTEYGHIEIQFVAKEDLPGDFAPGDHRGAGQKFCKTWPALFEHRNSRVLTR